MCLTFESFDEMAEDRKRWERSGLPLDEARDRLRATGSTVNLRADA